MASSRWNLPEALILAASFLAAGILRIYSLTAGLPYISYVDEGHTLHRVIHMLSSGGWDPGWYHYPSLVMYLITIGVQFFRPFYQFLHGHELIHDLSPDPSVYYDIIEPSELIIIGRIVILMFSLGIVFVVGLLAYRIAGPFAATMGCLFAATLPVLLRRGAIVTVDTPATFFTVASLYFTNCLQDNKLHKSSALLAGLMAGFAFAAKYPSGAVFVAVAVTILVNNFDKYEKLRLILIASSGLLAGILVGMPSIILNFKAVLADIRYEAHNYTIYSTQSYWQKALDPTEMGILFIILAGFGLIVLLYQRKWKATVLGWLAFAVIITVFLLQFPIQEIRNILPLVPMGCISAGVLLSEISRYQPKFKLSLLLIGIVCALLFTSSVFPNLKRQSETIDSRVHTVNWLATNVRSNDRVLIMEELAILPHELGRIRGDITIVPISEVISQLNTRNFRYLVLGSLDNYRTTIPKESQMLQEWKIYMKGVAGSVEFGTIPTPQEPYFWRTNNQKIIIIKFLTD